MKRWAWNIFCILSLLIFASGITLWVRSYLVSDNLTVRPDAPRRLADNRSTEYSVWWERGIIHFSRFRSNLSWADTEKPGWYYDHRPATQPVPHSYWDGLLNFHVAGFGLENRIRTVNSGWWSVRDLSLPLWVFLPAGIPSWRWWRRWRGKGRQGFPVTLASKAQEKILPTEATENTEGTEKK